MAQGHVQLVVGLGVGGLVDVPARAKSAVVTSGGLLQRQQLGGHTVFDTGHTEGFAVVGEASVLRIGLLEGECVVESDEQPDQEGKGEDRVKQNPKHTADASHHLGLVKDIGEDEHEDGVQEVENGRSDGKAIGGSVHVRLHHNSGNQHSGLHHNKHDGLGDPGGLGESSDHASDDSRGQDRQDEVVSLGAVVDIQETPLGQGHRVGVQGVGWVLIQSLGRLRALENSEDGIEEDHAHHQPHANRQDDLGCRISLDQFPHTDGTHLRVSQGDNAVETSSHEGLPF